MTAADDRLRILDELSLAELEAIRLVLGGGSVIDWHRLNFENEREVREFLISHELDPERPADSARAEAVKNSAIAYLRRNFEFPIPKPVAQKDVGELLLLASGKGHRQLCACAILKVMHIIHHLEARELLFMLPISDQELFHLVEQKTYRVIGGMLARGFPILEFIGGRKNKDSLYTKLLSKPETHAAQIYDKLRFRIVTRSPDDIFPTMNYLMRHVFPFNYVIPAESTNTLFPFRRYCEGQPHLSTLLPRLQLAPDFEEREGTRIDNQFTAPTYRVVHFVVDMPVRVPQEVMDQAPPAAWALGQVIFGQTEFQIIDRETEQANEMGDASHDAYKKRQQDAVARRLKVGLELPPADEGKDDEPASSD
ncbi:MAG TPA: TIGR04552 family protein [Sandaracinaceae bacterium LLY-WYZ-13_1]|nr:TIGR04552 family protein [Sandaracinaceae bacterium LLY-WYZ-13_1]